MLNRFATFGLILACLVANTAIAETKTATKEAKKAEAPKAIDKPLLASVELTDQKRKIGFEARIGSSGNVSFQDKTAKFRLDTIAIGEGLYSIRYRFETSYPTVEPSGERNLNPLFVDGSGIVEAGQTTKVFSSADFSFTLGLK